ncbi:MAG: hypothetical protein E6K54_07860 [Gammaproteobacteria bacterium]|nr:MAG: hypothetical protein E6K54_07860 [Gammaproteobacteria bacterium]
MADMAEVNPSTARQTESRIYPSLDNYAREEGFVVDESNSSNTKNNFTPLPMDEIKNCFQDLPNNDDSDNSSYDVGFIACNRRNDNENSNHKNEDNQVKVIGNKPDSDISDDTCNNQSRRYRNINFDTDSDEDSVPILAVQKSLPRKSARREKQKHDQNTKPIGKKKDDRIPGGVMRSGQSQIYDDSRKKKVISCAI